MQRPVTHRKAYRLAGGSPIQRAPVICRIFARVYRWWCSSNKPRRWITRPRQSRVNIQLQPGATRLTTFFSDRTQHCCRSFGNLPASLTFAVPCRSHDHQAALPSTRAVLHSVLTIAVVVTGDLFMFLRNLRATISPVVEVNL